MTKDGKTRDIFFGIVAIATLIVAIIGATLAYFSISVSSNEGVINATAATVSIEYNDGQQVTAQADELIPSTFEVVQKVYLNNVRDAVDSEDLNSTGNLCIDSNDRQVCSAYRFTVKSDVERTITATLNNEHNGFTFLSYALYDVTNKTWFSLTDEDDTFTENINKCNNLNENEDDDCHTTEEDIKTYSPNAVNSIFGKTIKGAKPVNKGVLIADTTQVFDLILFIRENGDNQNMDQGKQYSGTIKIEVDDKVSSGQITGKVDY